MIWLLGDCLFSAEHLEGLRRVDDAIGCLDSRRDPPDVSRADV